MRTLTRPAAVLAAGALAAAALTGCSSTASRATEIRPGTITSLDDLEPVDDADLALTITWDGGEPVRLSIDQLEQMRTVEATIYEPFLKRDVTFQGVELPELLMLTGMPDDLDVLHTVALNEYEVDIPADAAMDDAAILATRADGELIPIDQGGPTRVVLTSDHPDVRDESLWIWSIATIAPGGSVPTS
ncbi:MAG: molybdopterin-dependent oxidoreductase [Cellulomonadaceae bacterium]|nr:molybdopterin-dependent oxidoreductase [Cellulomonadaceae bacterium]